jgi:hypothetical protein
MSFAGQRESFAKSVTHSDSSSMPRAGPAGREDQSDHSRSCLQADPLAILSIGRTASARKLRYRRKVLVHARGDKPRAPDADRTGTGSRLLPQRSSRSPAQVRLTAETTATPRFVTVPAGAIELLPGDGDDTAHGYLRELAGWMILNFRAAPSARQVGRLFSSVIGCGMNNRWNRRPAWVCITRSAAISALACRSTAFVTVELREGAHSNGACAAQCPGHLGR